MKGKLSMVIAFLFGVIVVMGAFYAFVLVSPNLLIRDVLLSPDFYYEVPSSGYIYIDNEYIRFNANSFNGTLDYQITLNYEAINQ